MRFKYRSIEKNDKGRLCVISKEATPAQFIEHVKEKLHGMPLRFLAHNQKDKFDELIRNLNPDTLVLMRDYAEKANIKEPLETQSMHFAGGLLLDLMKKNPPPKLFSVERGCF